MMTSLLLVAAALGGMMRETVSVQPGWNAVYLETTPEEASADEFFSSLPVTRVGCYQSSVFSATAQLASDGSEIAQSPVAYCVWARGQAGASSLKTVSGGLAYLMFATNSAAKTFLGTPALPQTSWQKSADGFATITGVSVPHGETVSATAYFKEGPPAAKFAARAYKAWGGDETAPKFTAMNLFTKTPKLEGGKAYAFECETAGSWPGVLTLSTPNVSGVLNFSTNRNETTLYVKNSGTTNRTVRLTQIASERDGDEPIAMEVYTADRDNAAGWRKFTSWERCLAAGEQAEVRFAIDRTDVVDESKRYASIVRAEDVDGGTKMRVHVPVAAAAAKQDDPNNAAFPLGLWIGKLELSQVDGGPGTASAKAGGTMKTSVILLAKSEGDVRLMQRVTAKGRRVSALFPDMAHRSLAPSSGKFGSQLVWDWTVAADAADNPFRHAWHPDHGTSGSWPLANRVTLTWRTESGESTWSRNSDETTYGVVTWSIEGLNAKGAVTMRGAFAIKRVLNQTELE